MKVKIGQIQMHIREDKDENIKRAGEFIDEAADRGADIVVLPEMFNCPYKASYFPKYAEIQGGDTYTFLKGKALDKGVYIFGGSIPEKDLEGRIFNTCFIFDREGNELGRHRKTHLFDIDVKGGQSFRESDTLTAGDGPTVADTEFGKIGVMICYDVRFPEFARMMVNQGAGIIIVPGAFNMTTGPAHWEILFRTRAVDNQVFTVGTAPARDLDNFYVSYGNSMVVSPWGEILSRMEGEEAVMLTEIETDLIGQIREQLPLLKHRKREMYKI
jgi:predicted amidohydrolase